MHSSMGLAAGIVGGVLARTRSLMPAVEAEIVPEAGHSLPVDRADIVSRHVLRHIATEEPKSTR
jgi:hypothetical protein